MKPIPTGGPACAADVRVAIAVAIAMLIVLIAGCSRQPTTQTAADAQPGGVDSRGVGQIVAPATASSNEFGVYNALIIGIDQYSSWPHLKFAEADATRIGDLLTNEYGFKKDRVTRLIGAQ